MDKPDESQRMTPEKIEGKLACHPIWREMTDAEKLHFAIGYFSAYINAMKDVQAMSYTSTLPKWVMIDGKWVRREHELTKGAGGWSDKIVGTK